MNLLIKLVVYFRNMVKYIIRGGVVYYNVSNLYPSNRFKGKTVFITGGSSGFGLQMAKDFISEGAEVIITGRNSEKLRKAEEKIASNRLATMVWDVGDLELVEKNLKIAIDTFGKIDIFINNAGVYPSRHNFDSTLEDWNNVIKVNLTSVYFIVKAEALYLKSVYKKLGGGKIINITSIGAFKPNFDGYNIAKNGVAFFSEGLARKMAPYNICINCVAPGEALTSPEMCSLYGKTGDNYYYEAQPNHRFTRVEDISAAVLFLASEAANNITGIHMPVDGGWSVNH